MKILDLTHTIEADMPVYPGTEGPKINPICTMEKNGFREAYLEFYSHTGTHIDAPGHMIDTGQFLDDYDLDQFVGSALVLEPLFNLLDEAYLKQYDQVIDQVDFVLIKTNWADKWGTPAYFKGFPSLTEDGARYLAGKKLKGFGIDAISVDPISSKLFINHTILLGQKMILIENLDLRGVDHLDMFLLSVLPLKTKKADGSPVRATAIYSL